jgi:hypothetical protein
MSAAFDEFDICDDAPRGTATLRTSKWRGGARAGASAPGSLRLAPAPPKRASYGGLRRGGALDRGGMPQGGGGESDSNDLVVPDSEGEDAVSKEGG